MMRDLIEAKVPDIGDFREVPARKMAWQLAARFTVTRVGKARAETMARGKEFTDRLFGLRKRAATGSHAFDALCAALGIDHRLTPPKSPWTNGMVERFNGRIEEVLQGHHFRSGETWRRRCTATSGFTISSFLNQPWEANRPCRR